MFETKRTRCNTFSLRPFPQQTFCGTYLPLPFPAVTKLYGWDNHKHSGNTRVILWHQPKQCTIKGQSLKITIPWHCLKMGSIWWSLQHKSVVFDSKSVKIRHSVFAIRSEQGLPRVPGNTGGRLLVARKSANNKDCIEHKLYDLWKKQAYFISLKINK